MDRAKKSESSSLGGYNLSIGSLGSHPKKGWCSKIYLTPKKIKVI
jgi:hypothetical protein